MRTEFELELWQTKADKTFEELKNLPKNDQLVELDRQSRDFENDHERRAFQDLVYGRLRLHNEGPEERPTPWISNLFKPDVTAGLTGVLVFIAAFFELGFRPIWSLFLALATAVGIRILFRMFDRNFVFRRLFIAWIGGGLALVGGQLLVFFVDIFIGTVEWGGPPSIQAVAIWIVGAVVLGPMAHQEAKRHGTD